MVRLLSAALLASATALFLKEKKTIDYFILKESAGIEDAQATVPDLWFENQLLDHTDPSNKKTWKQRYHVNSQWFKGGNSPVFLYINGENVAHPTTVTTTSYFMSELAIKYGALVVSVEHRFYGQSQPTGDLNLESLKYLTMEQALADLANFQKYYVSQNANLTSANKWITFGGSYPGMLSGFAMSKYPDIFAGSVASSAPIHTKTDFFEYSEKVAYGLKFKDLHELVAAEDTSKLNSLFNLCAPIKNDLDRMTVELGIFGGFRDIAQFNGLQDYSLTDVCNDFAAGSGTPIEKLANWTKVHIWDSSKCTGSDYKAEWLDYFSNTTVSDNIDRQWVYQTCAEFGFGQTTAKSNSLFGVLKYGTVENVYYEVCKDIYNITNTEDRAAATRKTYGSLQIDVANVVWPTGTIDPWSALALSNSSKPVNPRSEVVDIPGTAHCCDMFHSRYNFAPQWAHDRIEAAVVSYLHDKC
ncbi:unnamed protein product [Aphanomyces euteiches]